MANNNAPFGFLPLTSATGAGSNYEMAYKPVAYDDTTKIYRGDPVKLLTTGYIAQWTASTAVSQLAGIFWGCHYVSSSIGTPVYSQFWPGADVASTAQGSLYAQIIPCTGAIPPRFVVQSDSTGVAFADIGTNLDVNLGTGNTITGASGAYLTVSGATTATLPFRVTDLYGSPSGFGNWGGGGVGGIQPSSTNPYGGSATGAYNWVIVVANISGAGATGLS